LTLKAIICRSYLESNRLFVNFFRSFDGNSVE
jgi:hypothetical protein